jgi:hypothetical protein
VAEEREQRLVRFGEIEGVLQGAPGGVRAAERVAGDGPSKNAAATQTRWACGMSRRGMSTAVACRSAWASRGIATTSRISPLLRSPADYADRLPPPCALEEGECSRQVFQRLAS